MIGLNHTRASMTAVLHAPVRHDDTVTIIIKPHEPHDLMGFLIELLPSYSPHLPNIFSNHLSPSNDDSLLGANHCKVARRNQLGSK